MSTSNGGPGAPGLGVLIAGTYYLDLGTVLHTLQAPNVIASNFVGTVSKTTTTLTFSSAADDALCQAGSIVKAGGVTMHLLYDSGSLTWTVAENGTIGVGTAITSIQGPSRIETTSAGAPTRLYFADTAEAVMSGATCQYYMDASGNVGIGTTDVLQRLSVVGHIKSKQLSNSFNGGLYIENIGAGRALYLWADDYDIAHIDSGSTGAGVLAINQGGGKVGIGTVNPIQKSSIFGGNSSIHDNTILDTEVLTNGALTAGTSWTRTNDCALASDNATWIYSAGTASTLSQAAATLAMPGVGIRFYKFVYTVSGITGTPSASITTSFASATTALTLASGTQTTYFTSAAAPGAFTITSTLTVGQAFTLDTLSLTEVTGGDLYLGGGLVLGPRIIPPGTTANQTMNRIAGRVNIAASGTSVTVTNNKVTANSIVIAVAATADATGFVKSVVPGPGSFVINCASVTAETAFNWIVIN